MLRIPQDLSCLSRVHLSKISTNNSHWWSHIHSLISLTLNSIAQAFPSHGNQSPGPCLGNPAYPSGCHSDLWAQSVELTMPRARGEREREEEKRRGERRGEKTEEVGLYSSGSDCPCLSQLLFMFIIIGWISFSPHLLNVTFKCWQGNNRKQARLETRDKTKK